MKQEGHIYVKNKVAGKSVYSKLQDVLQYDKFKLEKNTFENYDTLGKVVTQNYENYNKRISVIDQANKKYNKSILSSSKSIKKLINNSSSHKYSLQKAKEKEIDSISLFTSINRNISNLNIIDSFKKAILECDSIFLNKEKSLFEINKYWNIDSINNSIENNDTNTIRSIETDKLSYLNTNTNTNTENNDNDNDNQEEISDNYNQKQRKNHNKTRETSNIIISIKKNNLQSTLSTSNMNNHNHVNTSINKIKNTTSYKLIKSKSDFPKTQQPKKKYVFVQFGLKQVLENALFYLYINKISIKDYHDMQIIPRLPFSSQKAYEFFEAIKYNKVEEAVEYLKKNKKLLFDFDYFGQTCFHWAAKRNYTQLLLELISFGKHVNLIDKNKRTPLHLAAYNNHYQAVKILIDNDASPFMKNINNKTPIEICQDVKVKKLIEEGEKKFAFLNAENFLKEIIIKKYTEEIKSYLLEKRQSKDKEDNDKEDKEINNTKSNTNDEIYYTNILALKDVDTRKYNIKYIDKK